MKKYLFYSVVFIVMTMTSCATILVPGPASDYQRTKPKSGEPKREVRVGYLIVDIIFFPIPLIVDFATGEIYKDQGQ